MRDAVEGTLLTLQQTRLMKQLIGKFFLKENVSGIDHVDILLRMPNIIKLN